MPFNDQEPQPVGKRELGDFFLKFLQRLGTKQPGQESKETDPHILRVTRFPHISPFGSVLKVR